MAQFSFDIASDYDKAEMNNVFLQSTRDLANRYDFKGTPAAIEWLGDKTGFVVTAGNDMQLESIIDIVRRNLINRGQSTKVLDLSKEPVSSNLKLVQDIPFIAGLDSEKAKQVSKAVRDSFPKTKVQIQGDEVRVTSGSKDELQSVMRLIKERDLEFPIVFRNFR